MRERAFFSPAVNSSLRDAEPDLASFPPRPSFRAPPQNDDLKNFRQWNSMTPGHPENFITNGIEVTTGPLGMGICNSELSR